MLDVKRKILDFGGRQEELLEVRWELERKAMASEVEDSIVYDW